MLDCRRGHMIELCSVSTKVHERVCVGEHNMHGSLVSGAWVRAHMHTHVQADCTRGCCWMCSHTSTMQDGAGTMQDGAGWGHGARWGWMWARYKMGLDGGTMQDGAGWGHGARWGCQVQRARGWHHAPRRMCNLLYNLRAVRARCAAGGAQRPMQSWQHLSCGTQRAVHKTPAPKRTPRAHRAWKAS